jgi:hypothetical protein
MCYLLFLILFCIVTDVLIIFGGKYVYIIFGGKEYVAKGG